jgi:hypothetical protein
MPSTNGEESRCCSLGYGDTGSLKEKDVAQNYSDDQTRSVSKCAHLVKAMSRMQ